MFASTSTLNSNSAAKRLLITGSTGFVGRNLLLHALQDSTWSEIILPIRSEKKLRDQLKYEKMEHHLTRLHIIEGDSLNWRLDDAPAPDIAIHSAGLTFARERASYFVTNVDGSIALLEALPENCRLVVLSSQSAAGPTPANVMARQRSHEETPHSWYGESKLAMEKKLMSMASNRLLILRPPMILGPRDTATLPLFQMARGPLRIKPGLHTKHYSWIDVDDLCRAILTVARSDWSNLSSQPYFLASDQTITDISLIQTTADVLKAHGITLRLPHSIIQLISFIADKIPALHEPLQSLGRDRVKEILPQRWVVDGSDFQRDFSWKPQATLQETLERTKDWLEYFKTL